ncbi:MAG: amidase [bacterium]
MKNVIPKTPMEGLAELAAAMARGDLHPLHYLELLQRRFQSLEPLVQAFVPQEEEILGRLARDMVKLQESFPESKGRPALYAVPVGVKDIIHVRGFPTRAGSLIPQEVLGGDEGPLLGRLRELGAIPMGKTHTAEFAYLAPAPTRNPHDLDRTPGGSSSGSAAAVACGLCPLALGTQTVGSTLRPAAYCGIVGFKPSFGRLSTQGTIPLSPSLDHMGLFTRDLEGMLLVCSLLLPQWREPRTVELQALGVPEGPYLQRAGQESLSHFKGALKKLQAAGFQVTWIRVMENFEELALRHNRLMAAEAAMVHSQWFGRFRDLYRPETRALIERGMTVSQREMDVYRESRLRLRDALDQIMEEKGISLWISPATVGPPPLGIHSTGESIMNLPWTHAGLPALALPAGTNPQGLPMALQLVAGWMKDEELLHGAGLVAQALAGILD